MDAVTYPASDVRAFFLRELVPLRLPHDHQPLAEEWGVARTPCVILMNEDGREYHRATGFMAPEDLLAAIKLGMAKIEAGAASFESAITLLDRVLEELPSTEAVPEALYLRGRCLYLFNQDPDHLKVAYEQLKSRFPRSEWTRRAFKYRLL